MSLRARPAISAPPRHVIAGSTRNPRTYNAVIAGSTRNPRTYNAVIAGSTRNPLTRMNSRRGGILPPA